MSDELSKSDPAITPSDAQNSWMSQVLGLDPTATKPASPHPETAGPSPESGEPISGQGKRPAPNTSQPPPGDPAKSGGSACAALLRGIIALSQLIEQLFEEAVEDRRRLWDKERRGVTDDSGTTWSGHRQSYDKQRERLRLLLAQWEANCQGTPLSTEEAEELELAHQNGKRNFPAKPEYAAREEAVKEQDRPIVNESSTIDKVIAVFTVLGLSLLLVPEVVIAVADPEPSTKLIAIGCTVATIAALGKALGFSVPHDGA